MGLMADLLDKQCTAVKLTLLSGSIISAALGWPWCKSVGTQWRIDIAFADIDTISIFVTPKYRYIDPSLVVIEADRQWLTHIGVRQLGLWSASILIYGSWRYRTPSVNQSINQSINRKHCIFVRSDIDG